MRIVEGGLLAWHAYRGEGTLRGMRIGEGGLLAWHAYRGGGTFSVACV